MKTPLILFLLIILSTGIQISCSSQVKNSDEKNISTEVIDENNLPKMKIIRPDSSTLMVNSLLGKKLILVLFQPDCDHCQNEARQIAERLPAFAEYIVYFIATDSLSTIEKFSRDYKLNSKPNIFFAQTEAKSIVDNFGPIQAPSIYIYSPQGKQLNNFNGEMEIDVVIKYL